QPSEPGARSGIERAQCPLGGEAEHGPAPGRPGQRKEEQAEQRPRLLEDEVAQAHGAPPAACGARASSMSRTIASSSSRSARAWAASASPLAKRTTSPRRIQASTRARD